MQPFMQRETLHTLSNNAAQRFLNMWTGWRGPAALREDNPNLTRTEQIEKDCTNDLIGQTVHECMKLLHGSGLTPEQQSIALTNIRKQTVEEWHKKAHVSTKERAEREQNEIALSRLIEQHQTQR